MRATRCANRNVFISWKYYMGAAEEERLMKMFHLSHKLPFSSGKEWYIVSYGDINRINNRHTQSGHSN